MATSGEKVGHLERTAAEPRGQSLHTVTLSKVDQVNDQIRVFRLEVPREGPVIRFLPGQWLDVFVPGVPKAGGFTITSAPSKARWRKRTPTTTKAGADVGAAAAGGEGGEEEEPGYLELAVQRSPDNPPAAWLWQGDAPEVAATILGKELRVRIGGSFVWPPPGINVRSLLRKAVFVAGGVGVNPLVSMLSAIAENPNALAPSFEVEFLYSVRRPPGSGPTNDYKADQILFLDRIASIFAPNTPAAGARRGLKGKLRLFLTGGTDEEEENTISLSGYDDNIEGNSAEMKRGLHFLSRRITVDDVTDAVGRDPANRRFAVVYICGVPAMTDEFARELTDPKGPVAMEPHRVLCEKWW
ncbi:hypothetical protein SLS62_004854 [Diatrype stigma]|uniref:FAD-binding FR-type domain-containing protein n=1 Tax=Diatrype stigma TaxID=117547 RepID=A0AAN9YNW2_9PEZI